MQRFKAGFALFLQDKKQALRLTLQRGSYSCNQAGDCHR